MKFTNTVDIIYAAWPAFLYTNPAIGRYLLEPVLAYQVANPVSGGYSVHDIGGSVRLSQCLFIHSLRRGFVVPDSEWNITR